MRAVFTQLLAITLALGVGLAEAAEEKKKEEVKPQPPILAVSLPLGVVPGTTNRITLRGQYLTNVTALHFLDAKFESATRIKTRDKAKMPDKADAKKIGDTQIDLELWIPADTPPGPISYYVENDDGLSPTNQLVVVDAALLVKEREPNGGFKSAQSIRLPATITGSISEGMDVDVYRFEARAGQRLRAEVLAARHGSALDATLTLYDARGHILATADDTKESRDALLEFTPPSDGACFLALTDSHDKAGPTHVYLLVVRQD